MIIAEIRYEDSFVPKHKDITNDVIYKYLVFPFCTYFQKQIIIIVVKKAIKISLRANLLKYSRVGDIDSNNEADAEPNLPIMSRINIGNMTNIVPAQAYKTLAVKSLSENIENIRELDNICNGPCIIGLCSYPIPWKILHEYNA
jgi:hypothetical protein